jgi:lactose/L-arabinose transport system ATP-binding protein
MIYVTHDQVEAMTLADKIVVLRAGRVEQVGRPLDLYHDPDNKFVAGFIGSPAMNFVNAIAEKGSLRAPGLGTASVPTSVALTGAGAKVSVGLRPQHLSLAPGATHRVEVTEALGGVSYIHLSAPTGERLIVESREDPKVTIGQQTGIAFDPADAMVFDEGGARLR